MLQNGFLRNRSKPNISKKRFWVSVALGIGASYSFYTLLCFISLFTGLFDLGTSNYVLATGAVERYWQNFNFALISLVLGNAMFLLNLFRKPDYNPVPGNVRLAVVNDQRFLPFNFSYLLFKLGLMVALLSDSIDTRVSEMKYILPLAVSVIFFESWKSIIRYFKKAAYKPLLLNFSILLVLAFGFAFTSVFPAERIENIRVSFNPFVELPVSDYEDNVDIYFRWKKLKVYEENNQLLYLLDSEKIANFDLLGDYLREEISKRSRGSLNITLLMPQNISLKNLVKLENRLTSLGYLSIKYITKFNDEALVNRFDARGLHKELHFINTPDSASKIPLPPQSKDAVASKTIKIYLSENAFIVDNEKIAENELVEFFIKHIDSVIQFNYVYNDNVTYQTYITLLASHKQAIQDLRYNDERVKLKFEDYFRPLNRKEYEADQQRIHKKYPLLIIENYIE
ncbi:MULTISPECIES: hypothetical protein [Aequorivita]|uniref:Uncharacterized protein n=2 Tax=Aequorivita TaxID=153265 RepID=A0AB35YR96_9FLAO|nr:hypothetical protein [Aequorivita sp. Ant34-E75]WGF93047.1 hypothetical protein QCQ61_02375 [Aequorivita sp. Ant34-E75]